ncbi:MAG: pancreas/duodenum homeobox protein 1 [Desulfocapsaceae bacterium]|jgi:hypothetical protein|nr:pancreas/duodenum homeobox protein 1 [Desulfocapsaceae bacterium]
MHRDNYSTLFDKRVCTELLPPEKTNDFFEALFGDAAEGSYDIELAYDQADESRMRFNILLHERPGHCLACNLTQGLPQVFSRHPVIDIAGIVEQVSARLGDSVRITGWQLGSTEQRSSSIHLIPLTLTIA